MVLGGFWREKNNCFGFWLDYYYYMAFLAGQPLLRGFRTAASSSIARDASDPYSGPPSWAVCSVLHSPGVLLAWRECNIDDEAVVFRWLRGLSTVMPPEKHQCAFESLA